MDLLKHTIRREWRFAKDKIGNVYILLMVNKSNSNNVGCNYYKLEINLPVVDINTFIAIDEKLMKNILNIN